jgi:siderophore synthetase component
MTPPTPVLVLPTELRALARAQAAIAARTDLDEAFTWQCVTEAIRDRRATLIERADRLLQETLGAESTPLAPVLTEDGPLGRVH